MKAYDTIIVGAGTAGCVLANRLSADPARKVLLLEAGRAPPRASSIPALWSSMLNTEVDWSFHTEPQPGCKGRRLYWPRGRMVGGSGALNAMIYMRGVPSDYDRWAAAGCNGWSWKEVLPFFKRSEQNLRLGASPLHGSEGELVVSDIAHVDVVERLWLQAAQAAGLPANEDFNGPRQEGVGLFQATVKDGARFGTGSAFLAPALARPNLSLHTGVTLLRLIFDGTRATGVEFLHNGIPGRVTASSEVVLCAGAVGSPHLLLNSGIGAADELSRVGIRPLIDLPGVGKNLQDHVNASITCATHERFGIAQAADEEAELHMKLWEQDRSGPLASNWSSCGGFARVRPGTGDPDLQLYCIPSANRDHNRHLSAGPGITLFSVLQRPQSHGELRLRSADPLEAPAIDPRYFSDAQGSDLQLLVEGIRLNREILRQAPIAEHLGNEISASAGAVTDAQLRDFVRGHASTLYHPTSTCKMGIDDLAVVDPTLKVHGIEGLYVADASVFPCMVSGNTNAPTVMVAERAARFIAP